MYSIWERIKSGIYELFQRRAVVTIIVFCIMFSILVGRLFQLQIVNGQSYLDDYILQIQKTRTIQGTRGNIYDRNGKLLAYNELAYVVTVQDNGEYANVNDRNAMLLRLVRILNSHGEEVVGRFEMAIDENGEAI